MTQSHPETSRSLVKAPQADLNKYFGIFYTESALFVRQLSSSHELAYHYLPAPCYGVFTSDGDLVAGITSAQGAQEWVRMEGCYPVWMH